MRIPGRAAYFTVVAMLSIVHATSLSGQTLPMSDPVAKHWLAVAESAAAAPPDTRALWQQRLDAAHDTLVAALHWNNEHASSSDNLRILLALGRFWNGAAYVAEWDNALARPLDGDSALRARALNTASATAFRVKDQARARAWAEQSIALYGALHDSAGMGRAYERLVQIALRDNQHDRLRALADTGQLLCNRGHDSNCVAYFLNMRGESARVLRQYDSAAFYYQIADTIYRRISPAFRLDVAHNIGFSLLALKRSADARMRFGEGLQHAVATGDKPNTAFLLAGYASAAAVDGRAEEAARLFGLYDALLEQTGRVADPADAVEYERYRSIARNQLGEAKFNQAVTTGRGLNADSVFTHINK